MTLNSLTLNCELLEKYFQLRRKKMFCYLSSYLRVSIITPLIINYLFLNYFMIYFTTIYNLSWPEDEVLPIIL